MSWTEYWRSKSRKCLRANFNTFLLSASVLSVLVISSQLWPMTPLWCNFLSDGSSSQQLSTVPRLIHTINLHILPRSHTDTHTRKHMHTCKHIHTHMQTHWSIFYFLVWSINTTLRRHTYTQQHQKCLQRKDSATKTNTMTHKLILIFDLLKPISTNKSNPAHHCIATIYSNCTQVLYRKEKHVRKRKICNMSKCIVCL